MPSPTRFAKEVREELARARRKFAPVHSLHEGYAVILEELDEFWREVQRKPCDPYAAFMELVQVAAMCERTAVDCLLPLPEEATR